MSDDPLEGLAWEGAGGLLPAVVQDAATGEVRMLGWMNREALAATLESGLVTFYSRSRSRLWRKGETSGHRLELVAVRPDCDGDALLVSARPVGPTCHTGDSSCFGEVRGFEHGGSALDRLEATIAERLLHGGEESYTARLAGAGTVRVAQKVGEEGVELALAAATGERGAVVSEAADLVYHLLVLLAQRQIGFAEVAAELDRRAARRPRPDSEGGG